jgi:hypothetical protein
MIVASRGAEMKIVNFDKLITRSSTRQFSILPVKVRVFLEIVVDKIRENMKLEIREGREFVVYIPLLG